MQPTISKRSTVVGYVLLALSLLGLGDSLYLYINYLAGESDICTVTAGCEIVLTSEFSTILGIPLSFLGLLFYVSLFVLSLLFLTTSRRIFLLITASIASLGFLMSIRFVYLQIFLLRSICEFCMVSAVLSTLLSTTSVFGVISERKGPILSSKDNNTNPSSYE